MAKLSTRTMAEKFVSLFKKASEGKAGYHEQMVSTANIFRDHGVAPEQAIDLMHQASGQVTRRIPATGEIERIVKWSYQNHGVDGLKRYEKPRVGVRRNQDVINRWASKGSIQKLMQRSGGIPKTTTEILREMYRPDDLLHISPDIFHDQIKAANEWFDEGLEQAQYLCPCTFKGKEKGRLALNVDIRKYVVFETDEMEGNFDGQAGLIDRLSQELPLKMVCWSGNKSLHAFFDANLPNKNKIQDFHDLVITLGGDRAVLRAAQMVRCPWGTNTKTNKTQKVIFFK